MLRVLAAVAVLTVGLVACEGDAEQAVREGVERASEAADEARRAVEDAARTVEFCSAALSTAEAAQNGNWGEALEAAENLVEVAPDEMADDARTLLEGARAYEAGDEEAVRDPEFRGAAERVAAYAQEHCDPRS